MARVDEVEHPLGVELWPDRLQRIRIQRLGEDEVERGERRGHRVEILARLLDPSRKLVEDPLDLEPLGELRLAQRIVGFQDLERFDEDGLPARGLIVHDPFDRGPVLGLHRHDVAPAALRHDRILQEPQEIRRMDEAVEALLQTRLRRAQVGAKRAEPSAGPFQDLAGGSDRVLDRGRDVDGRSRETRARRERRVRPHVGEEPLRGADRVRYSEELSRIERSTQPRAPERIANVAGAAQSARRARTEKGARGRRLVLETLRLTEVGRWEQRFGELSSGCERGAVGDEGPDRGELQADERAFIHGRETPEDPRTCRRQGLLVVACRLSPMRADRTTRDAGTAGAS